MSDFKKEKSFNQANSNELIALAWNWAEQMEFQFLAENNIWIQLSCDLQMLVHNIYSFGPLNCKECNLKHNSPVYIQFLHTYTHTRYTTITSEIFFCIVPSLSLLFALQYFWFNFNYKVIQNPEKKPNAVLCFNYKTENICTLQENKLFQFS